MLFFSRKHNLLETPLFEGFKDFHNHTLPAVDDGVKSMEDALDVLAYFEQLGIKEVVLTPHVMVGVNQTSELVLSTFEKLQATYNGPIKLSLASEYMLDYNFMEQFQKGVRMLSQSHLLVETSYLSAPENMDELLYEVACEGVTPMVAHPERYHYMQKPKYHSLKESGCGLQLNLLSLGDVYGTQVTKNALYILEQGLYDVMGTDLHSLRSFKGRIARMKLSSKHIDMLLKIKENIL